MLRTKVSKKATLEHVSSIRYLVWFKKDQDNMQALIDSGSKVNAMNPFYTKKLGFHIKQTDVGDQKIDRSQLNTFGIVITCFLLQDKLRKVWFF